MRKGTFGFVIFWGLVLFGNKALYAQPSKTIEPKRDTLRYCSGKVFSIIETDEKGQYHGATTRFYRNGKPSEIEVYNHGILDGKCIYFYDSGDTSVTVEIKNGIQHGKVNAFYQNKKAMFTDHYFGGKLLSESMYYDTNGAPFNGRFKEYYYRMGKGSVREVNCTNGKPDGDLMIFGEESCSLLFKFPFQNGLLEGRAICYKNNGTIANASLYEKGKYVREDDSLYAENINSYTRYLHFDSTNSSIFYLRAIAHLRLGEKTAAVKDLNKVIKLEPKNYKAYYNRGVILADSLPLKALSDFKKSNAIQPDFYFAHHNTGFVYFKLKDYKKAIEGFKKALLYKPEYLPSINYLGLVYEILKDKKKSNFYFDLAESIQTSK